MRFISRYVSLNFQFALLLLLHLLLFYGCSLEKESALNRGLQNLTAHYNILFNANQLLAQKQEEFALAYVDNYNQLLNVYQDTTARISNSDKDLDAVIVKANTIINVKEQSHYIGDAYLLLGKANFLSGNYYNAIEYFDYVIRSFPKQAPLVLECRAWKVRALIYLGQFEDAKLATDTALQNIDLKNKNLAGYVYASCLQYNLSARNYSDAESLAKLAVQYTSNKKQRQRIIFILAQVQELNNNTADAYNNYSAIVNSNADFEMAFNANLNRIRIDDKLNGRQTSRIDQLRSLLKNPNNKEFNDQVYYQVAEYFLSKNDFDNAIKNYTLSVRVSMKNQTQKALSYLRLADINFKNKANYPVAKKYYDSTLTNLPPNYPGYVIIRKKSDNLQLLTDRLQTIATEDTLQMLAGLDEKTRLARIDAMVNAEILKQQSASAAASANVIQDQTAVTGVVGNSNFYFYNASAISQGFSDFKRKWGNRKLEDNWRRSSRQSSNITANTDNTNQNLDPDAAPNQLERSTNAINAANYRQQLMNGLPLSPLRMQQSNNRIYNAYLDIANFYRDIIGDKKEAIATYQLLLDRFPSSSNKPAIYYNLYRLYSDDNATASNEYKSRLLKEYPETNFARIIIDPAFGQKLADQDAEFNALYNDLFASYSKRDYQSVIRNSDALLKQFPANKFEAQVYYIKAMAAGHSSTLQPFTADLQSIAIRYPYDKLIGPLVKQHLAYINANQAELAARPVVLTDTDPDQNPFSPDLHQQVAKRTIPKAEVETTARQIQQLPAVPVSADKKIIPLTSAPVRSVFSERDSTNYYFVINVSSVTVNLSSARFGIGQFNRANFEGNTIKHQLLGIGDDNQLIYVGRFYSMAAVKDYARAIIPLLPEIMKVPQDKYTFFIITQENLNKLADKKTLESYTNYSQQLLK